MRGPLYWSQFQKTCCFITISIIKIDVNLDFGLPLCFDYFTVCLVPTPRIYYALQVYGGGDWGSLAHFNFIIILNQLWVVGTIKENNTI